MKMPRISASLRVALLYALFGGGWILLSDNLLFFLAPDHETASLVEIYKGLAFVAVTAYLLYWERRKFEKDSLKGEGQITLPAEARSHASFVLALLLPFIALGIQWLLWPYIAPYAWLLFLPVVFFSSRLGGLKVGLFSTFLSSALVWYFFIPPQLSWEMDNPYSLFSVIIFLIMGYLFSDTQERLRLANRLASIALGESESRFSLILQTSPNAMIIVSKSGQIVQVNERAEKTFGYEPGKLNGVHIEELVPERLRDAHAASRMNYLKVPYQSPLPQRQNLIGCRKDGSEFPVDISLGPIQIKGEAYVVATIVDITDRKQAEEKLRASEEKYRDLVENSQDLICTHDLEGRLLSVNLAAAKISGYSNEALLQMNLRDLLAADVRHVFEAYLEELQTQRQSRGIMKIQTADGEIRYLEYANTLRLEGVDAPVARGMARDITERKKAEEKYRNIFENSLNGIFQSTPDGRFITANPALARMWGYDSPQELIASIANTAHQIYLDPGCRAEHIRLLREHGDSLSGFEYQARRKDGSSIWVSENMHSVQDVDGNLLYFEGTVEDISRRKQAEDALQTQTALLDELFESAPEAIGLLSNEDRVIRINREFTRLFGYTDIEAGGQPINDLIVPDDRRAEAQKYSALVTHGERVGFETIRCSKDGSLRQVSVLGAPIRLPNADDQFGIYVIYRDIRERKRAEESLVESEERYRSLIESFESVIAAVDANGVFGFMNRAAAAALGGTAETLTGRNMSELFPPEIAESQMKAIRQVISSGAGIVNEALSIVADKPHWYQNSIQPIRGADGSVKMALVNALDITARKDAEAALRASEEQYRGLFENMSEGYAYCQMIFDNGQAKDWIYITVNNAFETLTGLKDVVGKRVTEVIPGIREADPKLFENYSRVALTGIPDKFEIFVQALQMWFSISVYSPKPEFFVAVFDVITERKRAEQALRESEEKYRLLFDAVPVGVGVANMEGEVLEANHAMQEIMGYSQNELRSIHLADTYTDPGERTRALETVQANGVVSDYEVTLKRRNGVVYPALLNISLTELRGQRVFLTVLRDITERKRAEEDLKNRMKELNAIYQASQRLQILLTPEALAVEIIQVLEKTLSYEYCAVLLTDDVSQKLIPFAISGLDYGEEYLKMDREYIASHQPAVGKGITGWVAEHSESVCAGNVQEDSRYYGLREGILSELCVPLTVGEKAIGVINIESTRSNAYSSHDQRLLETIAAQIAVAIQNASLFESIQKFTVELEQRVIERTSQLTAANQELEAFTYSVSHDLRAPLRAIDGYTRILLEDYEAALDAEGRRVCNIVSSEARRMGQLIDDLLNLSRINRAEIQAVPVDMAAMAHSVFADLMRHEKPERVDFTIQEMPSITGDPALMRQVWINLLNNALKFSSKKERAVIETGCSQNNGEYVYFVHDNGAGFDGQYANKLFGVFQRLHSDSEFEGTGVGLAIVQRVIHRHGGRLWAEGAVGRGATFYFALPERV